jgi:Type II restriction enzyme SfiI
MQPKVMFRDPDELANDLDTLEEIEQASMRLVAQALADSKEEAKQIFANWDDLAGDIGEDITRYAVDALGVSQIPLRIPGKVDYKRARYIFHSAYAVRQALLIDSKSEKAQTTARIQTSQTSMRIMRRTKEGGIVDEVGKLPKVLTTAAGDKFLTTTIFIKYFYGRRDEANVLRNIRIACVPNGMLQARYNPTADDTIWSAGPHSAKHQEKFRTRINFEMLSEKANWRVQNIPINPEGMFVWAG